MTLQYFLQPLFVSAISRGGVFLALGAAAAVCLAGAVILLWKHARPRQKTPVEKEPAPAPVPRPASSEDEPLEDELDTDFDDDSTDAVNISAELANLSRKPSAEDGRAAEAKGDYPAAALIWRTRGDFSAEHRALLGTENHRRIAELKRALGREAEAISHYRQILAASPDDERVRLLLIQALLDQDDFSEATALAEVLTGENPPVTCAPAVLSLIARGFESKGEFELARTYYNSASSMNEQEAEKLVPRMAYLRQIMRLAQTAAPSGAPDDLMDKALEEPELDFPEPSEGEAVPPATVGLEESFKPHEVIVGHLALGGNSFEHEQPVRSFASAAARFQPGQIVGERPLSAVIEARDRLIDCPVAIRLTRISTEGDDYILLRDRLRAISHLNHPNISKITYADRYGNIVRVVNEFHGGGNLKSLVARLNKVGFPLMLRILLQISSGLDEAHRNGIIHGDLRPENVMLGHDNMIKIVDFALKPWPIRDTAAGQEDMPQNQEMQADLLQFADIMEYLLEYSIIAPHIAQQLNGYDPMEDVRDLVKRAREGGFLSIHYIHRGIHSLLERVVPNSG